VRRVLSTDVDAFDPSRPYRLDPQVALRPEPFGALAYHYGNRRLTFLKAPDLVRLVSELDGHDTVTDAVSSTSDDPRRRQLLLRSLASLADSGVISAR
jgi:putative mycofactocin binding protein MftB